MKILLVFLVVCIIGVYSHGVLLYPTAWWKAPSRERPCGGATYNPNPSVSWAVGSHIRLTWQIVASDGGGLIRAYINTEGKPEFNTSKVVNVTVEQPPKGFNYQGYAFPNITVPNVKCTGPNNTCILQVSANGGGGWYSCATINITCKGCDSGQPISGDDCVKASGLSFCSKRNGDQVLVPDGQTALQVDGLVSKTFDQNHPNPNVFANGNSSACMSGYQELLCELYFPRCGNSTSTYNQQQCNKVIHDQCNITQQHEYLYDCTVFPAGPPPKTSGDGKLGNAVSISPSLFLLVALFLFYLF